MQITYYGHSCFMAAIKDKKILFDPYITVNELANHINIANIEADYIFLSHGHEDHISDAEAIASATGAKIVANYELAMWFAGKGITNYHAMNCGGKWDFDFGRVKCVNAVHSSAMPDGAYGGNALGFIFITDEKNFYYSGDTALTLDMQLIPMFAKNDFSILPLGDNFTMGLEDAAIAAKMLQTDTVIGIHYDTFGFIRIDHENAIAYFKNNGLNLLLPKIGETMEV